MSDQERGRRVKKLSRICGQKGILPRSMHIKGLSEESTEAECLVGYASVFKNLHNGILVAVKVIKIYLTSDTESIFRVSSIPTSIILC